MAIKIKNNYGKSRIINVNDGCKVVECAGLTGKSITITNGKILVDGKPIEEYEEQEHCKFVVNVTVQGNCDNIENCDDVEVNGDCVMVNTVSGDVSCRDVKGSVRTVSGDVECGNVGGSVSTVSGDINRR